MSDDIIGRKIGNYEILEQIGEGGMGKVYKGIHSTLDRIVALKMITPQLVSNTEIIGRFYNEAKIQAQLNHPNIVIVYDFIKQSGNYYIVMEYVKGESVGKIIKDQGPFEINLALNMFNQILSGISHAHKKGIIHRDIKPNNFILTPNVVKITDFGIAHIISDNSYTVDGSMLGTPKYMSPEQILETTVDHRSDIYSLGISMFEILTGHVPFESESNSDYEVKKGHVEIEPPKLTKFRRDIPPQIEAIILKTLAKKPEGRYQTVWELIEAVNKYDLDLTVIDVPEKSEGNIDLTVDTNGFNGSQFDQIEYDDSGEIYQYSVPFIISTFYKERRSGILHVDSEIQMNIYFIKGYIVYLEGVNKRFALAEILVDRSKITREDQEYAISFAHETGLRIGEALIKMGKITPHELSEMLETQIKQKLIEASKISTGKYYYQDTQNINLEVMYNLNPLQVVYDSVAKSDLESCRIYKIIKQKNTRIKINGVITNELSKIKLRSTKEIKLANALKDNQTVGEILEISPLEESSTLAFLTFLKLSDFIDIDNIDHELDQEYKITKSKDHSHDKTDRMSVEEIEEFKLLTEKN